MSEQEAARHRWETQPRSNSVIHFLGKKSDSVIHFLQIDAFLISDQVKPLRWAQSEEQDLVENMDIMENFMFLKSSAIVHGRTSAVIGLISVLKCWTAVISRIPYKEMTSLFKF